MVDLREQLNVSAIYIKGALDIVILEKGIFIGKQEGGKKRTGGLGDILVGVMATNISLAQQTQSELWKAMGLSHLITRKSHHKAW